MTKLKILRTLGISSAACLLTLALSGVAAASSDSWFQGFEADTDGWFTLPARVASGTDGISSATGGWHAQATGDTEFTRWGSYNGHCTVPDDPNSCFFPAGGFDTSVAFYLDPAGKANDSRFEWTSAASKPDNNHSQDFIFSCGFYNDSDAYGTGERVVCSASSNSPGWPKNPGRDPQVVAQAAGWYTFLHEFRDDGAGVLEVTMKVVDSSGSVTGSWTLPGQPIYASVSDDSSISVSGNRYGWFIGAYDGVSPYLAIDDSQRVTYGGTGPAYSCVGFGPPADRDISINRPNRVVPLRMTLLDGDEAIVGYPQAAPVLQVVYGGATPPSDADLENLDYAGRGDEGNMFIFDGTEWAFNLSTKALSSGTYVLSAVSGDDSEYVIEPTCEVTVVIK